MNVDQSDVYFNNLLQHSHDYIIKTMFYVTFYTDVLYDQINKISAHFSLPILFF